MSYMLDPTKDNFLKIINERIAEYEETLEEYGEDAPCRAALLELKNIKQTIMVKIKEKSRE